MAQIGAPTATPNVSSPDMRAFGSPDNLTTGAGMATGLDRFRSDAASPAFGNGQGIQGIVTRLDRLKAEQSPIEALAAQPSILAAQPNQTQLSQGRVDIRVQAPVPNAFGNVDKSRYIEISVMPLSGRDLGSLNTGNQGQLSQLRADAAVRINRDNLDFHGKTTAQIRQMSIDQGYYNSPAHQAWAKAAEARTSGQIPASWWIQNDPYGGTAGNGPLIEPLGMYPQVNSKIAMGHDTDWTLGRQFGAGPLRDLATMGNGTSKDDFKARGMFGLWPAGTDNRFQAAPATDYTFGHEDWTVKYTNPW